MADRNTPKKYINKTVTVLRKEGVRSFGAKSLRKIAQKIDRPDRHGHAPKQKIQFSSIVHRQDVMSTDWVGMPYMPNKSKKISRKRTANWIISPPSNGGGHQNMFRFIEHLDKNGFINNIYLYTTLDQMPVETAAANVASYANLSNTQFFQYEHGQNLADSDILFATGWETAYSVFNEKTRAKKFYFIQDFEPLFYSMGTEYLLAENTYKFGFHGITAGRWLSTKLQAEYGMVCDAYDFGANEELYKFTNDERRKEVFFYARPVTERRAFDLGIMVLELFHAKHPDYIINLAGWDVLDYDIPFPYVNHKTLKLEELSDLYNKCATGLVLSLTNMSLLPLELIATGVIPVVNEGDNNRLVSDNPYISYTQPSPAALAKAMSDIVERKDLPVYAKKAARSTKGASWDVAKDEFMAVLEREIYG
jgi:O-antigen biosynthesis protein